MHLLGDVLARPIRRPLEADALVTCCVAHLAPTLRPSSPSN
jgi:hypothetical protein